VIGVGLGEDSTGGITDGQAAIAAGTSYRLTLLDETAHVIYSEASIRIRVR
jgi:hypothetical protein